MSKQLPQQDSRTATPRNKASKPAAGLDAEGFGAKNWKRKCVLCGAVPTVGGTDMCGPCCFGEADTAGGEW